MLFQSLVVAVEAAETYGPGGQDDHHFSSVTTDCLAVTCDDHNDGHAVDDNCDHCCHCHGHGSHVAVLVKGVALLSASPAGAIISASPELLSALAKSIYRPPIV